FWRRNSRVQFRDLVAEQSRRWFGGSYASGMRGSTRAASGRCQRRSPMKRIAFVLLLLVACSHATPPPTDTQLPMPGLISGTVIAKDGSVLPGVTVTLDGRATTVTDAQGGFRFLSTPPGEHFVVAELAGYGRATRIVTI